MKGKKWVWVGMGLGIVGLSSIHLQAQQAVNGVYDFHSITPYSGTTDPTPPPTAPGVTFGSFTAVGHGVHPRGNGRFGWTQNELGGMNGCDNFGCFTGSLNPAIYYEVTLAPQPLFTLDLDSISFGVRRTGTGIRSYAVRSSLDGFASNLSTAIAPANTNLGIGPDNSFRWLLDAVSEMTDQPGSRVVLGAAFQGIHAPVTFRFYAWNAEEFGGTFAIDDVLFRGSVMPVPEPGAIVMVPLGMTLLWRMRRGRIDFGKGGNR
jgi:hypothetical protein